MKGRKGIQNQKQKEPKEGGGQRKKKMRLSCKVIMPHLFIITFFASKTKKKIKKRNQNKMKFSPHSRKMKLTTTLFHHVRRTR